MKVLDILNAPWAIQPEKLVEIRDIYLRHALGEKSDIAAIEAQLGRSLINEPKGYQVIDGVAVLRIEGVLAKRMNVFIQISGGTSTELLARDFRAALADPQIHSILLMIDSPGGEVDGIEEMAQLVFEARKMKPIFALGSSVVASAAYWIGSAANKFFITGETTAVGSIGVVATHLDFYRQDEANGVRVTEITAGEFKRTVSEYRPLTRQGFETIKEQVDYVYGVFVDAVARNRRKTVDQVLQDMAGGRIFLGQRAIDAGLVDGFANMESLIARLNAERNSSRIAAPEAQANKEEKTMAVVDQSVSLGVDVLTSEEIKAREISAFDRGKSEGAKAERERIQAVLTQSLAGHEALIQELAFDGKTTGSQAAERVLAAEKAARERRLANLKADAPAPVPAAIAPEGMTTDDANVPIEERAKKQWDGQAKLREEFTSFAGYVAFVKAEAAGKVRILSKQAQ